MNTKKSSVTLTLLLFCILFTNTVYAQSNSFAFPYAFAAEDIYGKAITEKSLGEKEIFFVHYFATWCPPCVREMPDLAAIAEKYSVRVGFIGLLDDYKSNKAAAVRLADKAKIPFNVIDANHKDFKTLLKMVQSGYVPTSVLIGRDGKMIGDQIVGAFGSGYAGLIDKALGGR